MSNLDTFNPISPEHIQERERFGQLAEKEKQAKIDRLKENAFIENADSFGKMLDKEIDPKEREQLELALKVCEAVKEAGGLALVVGGFARDAALVKFGYDLKPKDIDIEVYDLDFGKLKAILDGLGGVNVVGAQFGVVKLGGLDISIPRRDSKTGKGHKGFTVEGNPEMTIKEAAQRRDFTINTLALDPITGEILDFYGGINDIRKKTLRATDEKLFGDDSLRVLRAAQFASRFGFEVDPKTVEICRSLDLAELPKERVGEEWLKLLMKSEKPSVGLEAMLVLDVLKKLHPEIEAIIGVPQNPEYHPEGDVWTHTKLVVDAAVKVAKENGLSEKEKLALVLSALCHDLGKAVTTKTEENGKITSRGHEKNSLLLTENFLKSLNINQDLIERVLLLVGEHMFIHNVENPSDSVVRRLARRLYPVTIKELAFLATADIWGSGKIRIGEKYTKAEALLEKAEELEVKDSKPTPLIMGRNLLEIGFIPGKKVGEVLKQIEELQLDGQIANSKQALEFAKKELIDMHTKELRGYGLGGLEGRIQRGLDPAGMLAVKATRELIAEIMDKVDVKMADLDRITKELHVGAVWKMADDLAKAEKAEIRAWMLLAHECNEVNEKDLTSEEYLEDFQRITKDLKTAKENLRQAVDQAVEAVLKGASQKFIIKDGVPFSEKNAFIYMAIAGEKYGVCKAGDLYFVGANELDYSTLEGEGLSAVDKEDRGRMTTFYQKEDQDIVKKLYPGFAIVFGDERVALKLAKSAKK